MTSVTCTFEKYPNYIGHLFGVSRIVFDSPYSDMYLHTVSQPDLQWLQSNRKLLDWGLGEEGPLSSSIVFLGGYLNPEGTEEMEEYFRTLEQCISKSTLQVLVDKYPQLSNLQDWVQGPLDDPYKLSCLTRNKNAITALRDIFIRNFEAFDKDVLPAELPKIRNRINETNAILSRMNYVSAWESFTGRKFKYPMYRFILSTGMGDGPNFNSLGYEKNWVYYDHPTLLAGIAHEIGTHLLIDIVKRYAEQFGFSSELYGAYETMCGYLVQRIFHDKMGGQGEFRPVRSFDAEILRTVERVFTEEPGIDVESALVRVAELTKKRQQGTA